MRKIKQTKRGWGRVAVIAVNLLIIMWMGMAITWGQAAPPAAKTGQSSAADTATNELRPDLTGASKPVVDLVSANNCQLELKKFAEPEWEKYKSFMEANFRNKSNTKSLMGLGIARYDRFKEDIGNKLQMLTGAQLSYAAEFGGGNAAQITGLADCESLARKYIQDASQMLRIRAITTSGTKKASLFVEKYKQLNSKLRALDLDIMKMVVGLSTFEQKLPCYLKSCN